MPECNEAGRLGDSVVVALRDRVFDCVGDAFARPAEEIVQSRSSFASRCDGRRKHAFAPEAGQRANGCLLSAAPLNAAEWRIAVNERFDRRPERLRVALVARDRMSKREVEHPGEPRRLPNVFHVTACWVETQKPT